MKTKILSTLAIFTLLGASIQTSEASYSPDQWERQIVAACLVLEASDQGEQGMIAVANVMHNRSDKNPSRIYREVKKPYAFSSLNAATTGKTRNRGFAGHVTRASRDLNWRIALRVVDKMYAGTLADLTRGATHYSLTNEYVSWMSNMKLTVVIGNHKFLRKS
jgi:spore germination cell wall hydrolase CwlJ-like protein